MFVIVSTKKSSDSSFFHRFNSVELKYLTVSTDLEKLIKLKIKKNQTLIRRGLSNIVFVSSEYISSMYGI